MTTQQTPSTSGLATGTWLVDPSAGRIGFAVKTMWGLVDVKGTFDRFEGALHVTDVGTRGELVVHTDSLDTKNKKRDEHLRAADFFDAKTHPRVTFTTNAVTSRSEGATITGDLVVGSHTTHLVLPVDITPDGADAVTFRTAVAVPREDVGLTWNKAGMIKGDARLDLELRLVASA